MPLVLHSAPIKRGSHPAGAEADWIARSTGTGVVWAHDFRSDTEVTAFRWVGGTGNDPDDAGIPNTCRRITTDGVTGACLELVHSGSTNPAAWWRPFSALSSTAYSLTDYADDGAMTRRAWEPTQGSGTTNAFALGNYAHTDYAGSGSAKDGTDFWLQFRIKVSASAFTSGSGKAFYLSRTEASLTAQEINGILGNGFSNFDMYTAGSPTLHGVLLNQQKPNQAALPAGEFDNIEGGSGISAPGWAWPQDTWHTFLIHVIPGHENDDFLSATDTLPADYPDTGIEVWAAAQGETSYTKIWSRSNYVFDFQNVYGSTNGWNALIFNGYFGATNPSPFTVRYCQVIFKKGSGSAFGSDPETYGISCPNF